MYYFGLVWVWVWVFVYSAHKTMKPDFGFDMVAMATGNRPIKIAEGFIAKWVVQDIQDSV